MPGRGRQMRLGLTRARKAESFALLPDLFYQNPRLSVRRPLYKKSHSVSKDWDWKQPAGIDYNRENRLPQLRRFVFSFL
jgi:hypothetical protein